MNKPIAALLLLALSACTTVEAPGSAEGELERIAFATEPCFGFCPAFEISVTPEGEGRYFGHSFVKATGARQFSATPAQFAAFRERLAPFRPANDATYGYDNCDGPLATDNPSVKVTWYDENGGSTTLDWYLGCRQPGLAENSDAIYRAYEELPLAQLLGPDDERQSYGPR